MSISLKKSPFLLFAPLLLTFGACGNREDLIEVQKFSQLADRAAVTAFPHLASDFYQSCLRAAHYRALLPDPQASVRQAVISQILDPQASGRQAVISRIADLQKCSDPFEADKDFQSLTPGLIEANNVLVQYMTGLGKLASDEVVDYHADLDGLKNQLVSASSELEIQTELVRGTMRIAQLLLQATTDGYRREKLQQIIVSSDPYIQKFAEGMKQIFADEYINVYLKNEESKVSGYYADYQQNLLKNQIPGDSQSLTVLLLDIDDRWQQDREKVAEKKALAQSYIELINTIANSHQSLSKMYGAGQKPSPETFSKLLDENTQALETFVRDFEEIKQMSALVN